MKTNQPYSDPQLIALLKQQDVEAYNYIFEKYGGALYSLINQVLPGNENAGEVLEESFTRISKKITEYEPSKSRLFPWILRVTRETALEKLKSQFHRTSSADPHQLAGGLTNFTQKLDAEQQQLIEMIYLKGFSAVDVAKHFNISVEKAETIIKRTLSKLNRQS